MSILNLQGAYENELTTAGEFNPQAPKTSLMLPSGQRVVLPTATLLQAVSGANLNEAEVARTTPGDNPVAAAAVTPGAEDAAVIPLVEEQILVGKREVETARVRIRRETEEHVQTVSVALTDVRWEVEHVPIGQRIESHPEIRKVGETTIFPLVEERMVVTRELWLSEEVHVRQVKTTTEKSAEFPVRRDHLVEERS